jgi:signal-transduction protein with cAMP-binding, CBS, and nucleotidyltransferase domain
MTTNVPRVGGSATVLEAVEAMNLANSTGIAVVNENGHVMGVITALRLLREFYALNKKPEDVKASQVMGPFYRISPNAATKEAARKILSHGVTRLGVFESEEFLGWVSLTDLTREFGKRRLIDALRSREESEDTEFLCPNCRGAFLDKVANKDGEVQRWACPNCGYSL